MGKTGYFLQVSRKQNPSFGGIGRDKIGGREF